jgi:uncharacterized protein YhfF
MSQTAQKYWNAFLDANPEVPKEMAFQIWYFGNTPEMAQELAELVISEKKSATASLAAVNELKPEQAPIPNGFSVVTDFHGRPICVIQTTEIRHLPFAKVEAQFAFDEGEGDQTLEYWHEVHRLYFAGEAAGLGTDFNEQSIVCCERFRLLYTG